jgi:hypothetical protein
VGRANAYVCGPGRSCAYAACMAEARGGWRRFGEKTIYDNRWVRLGLIDVEAPNGDR